jgi:succinate-semialdehyde dehydrogenase/glutarate-semialdehyde dehydrogenase
MVKSRRAHYSKKEGDAMLNQIKSAGWLREENFINGQWIAADDDSTIIVEDPATGKHIGSIPRSGAAETHRAIDAAQAAFVNWSLTTAAERAELLQKMAHLVRENLDELTGMLTLEQGKPIAEARAEMKLGADYIQWFAEEARRINGEIIPSPWKDRQILVTREPIGVVGAISPWNFPFSMLARKVAPAQSRLEGHVE